MHTFSIIAALLAASAVAQTLPPSPTASVGCHSHGDHWHCDGPASTTAEVVSTSKTLPPSPTASFGCESHGDHWHCEGPVSTAGSSGNSTTTATLAPSPTESVGCHPHGDHWHCSGPASASASATGATDQPIETGGVGKLNVGGAAIVGGLLAVMGMGF